GRDPRLQFETFSFSEDVRQIEDLQIGMILPGIVTNITAFGAFVDVGVHQDGLVHLSQMANRFIRDPNEVVHLHQSVNVKVLSVDMEGKRIQLSIKEAMGQ
ncbi:MAG: S1 RNA-binding domain-containing protein, partial [Bacteroidales bacterium]